MWLLTPLRLWNYRQINWFMIFSTKCFPPRLNFAYIAKLLCQKYFTWSEQKPHSIQLWVSCLFQLLIEFSLPPLCCRDKDLLQIKTSTAAGAESTDFSFPLKKKQQHISFIYSLEVRHYTRIFSWNKFVLGPVQLIRTLNKHLRFRIRS